MNARALRTTELTPEARVERAKRLIAEGIDELVEAKLAKGAAASEWIDQKTSPLGRRRHLELAREGKLPSVKNGRRVLVRRADVNEYLQKHARVAPIRDEDDVDEMLDAFAVGGRR